METIRVRPDPASAALVRHRVTASLTDLRVPAETIADVALVATELVSNSVRHAAALPEGDLCVDWDITPEGVIVRVTDGGSPLRPQLMAPEVGAVGGRGLMIVAAISDRWGVEEAAGEVTVWAHLPSRQDVTSLNGHHH